MIVIGTIVLMCYIMVSIILDKADDDDDFPDGGMMIPSQIPV